MVSIRNIWINLTKVRIQFNPCDIILFRLTGLSPFAGEDKQETCYNVSLAALDFPEEYFKNISHTAQDFIKRLLQRDVEYVSYQYLLNNNSLRFYWLFQSFFFVNIALTIMFRGSQRILVYIRIFLSPKNVSSVRIS